MNTQSQPSSQLSQLRTRLKSMPVAMLSSIDEHGALLSSRISRWVMDDCGALWFFSDPLCLPATHLPSINLTFADMARTRRISVSGQAEIYAEDVSPENLLEAIWLGRINPPRFIAEAQVNNQALLKFTPHAAVYWHAQQSLLARLFTLITSAFSGKAVPVKRDIQYVEWPPILELDALKPTI